MFDHVQLTESKTIVQYVLNTLNEVNTSYTPIYLLIMVYFTSISQLLYVLTCIIYIQG